jgi:hypothetical protein
VLGVYSYNLVTLREGLGGLNETMGGRALNGKFGMRNQSVGRYFAAALINAVTARLLSNLALSILIWRMCLPVPSSNPEGSGGI